MGRLNVVFKIYTCESHYDRGELVPHSIPSSQFTARSSKSDFTNYINAVAIDDAKTFKGEGLLWILDVRAALPPVAELPLDIVSDNDVRAMYTAARDEIPPNTRGSFDVVVRLYVMRGRVHPSLYTFRFKVYYNSGKAPKNSLSLVEDCNVISASELDVSLYFDDGHITPDAGMELDLPRELLSLVRDAAKKQTKKSIQRATSGKYAVEFDARDVLCVHDGAKWITFQDNQGAEFVARLEKACEVNEKIICIAPLLGKTKKIRASNPASGNAAATASRSRNMSQLRPITASIYFILAGARKRKSTASSDGEVAPCLAQFASIRKEFPVLHPFPFLLTGSRYDLTKLRKKLLEIGVDKGIALLEYGNVYFLNMNPNNGKIGKCPGRFEKLRSARHLYDVAKRKGSHKLYLLVDGNRAKTAREIANPEGIQRATQRASQGTPPRQMESNGDDDEALLPFLIDSPQPEIVAVEATAPNSQNDNSGSILLDDASIEERLNDILLYMNEWIDEYAVENIALPEFTRPKALTLYHWFRTENYFLPNGEIDFQKVGDRVDDFCNPQSNFWKSPRIKKLYQRQLNLLAANDSRQHGGTQVHDVLEIFLSAQTAMAKERAARAKDAEERERKLGIVSHSGSLSRTTLKALYPQDSAFIDRIFAEREQLALQQTSSAHRLATSSSSRLATSSASRLATSSSSASRLATTSSPCLAAAASSPLRTPRPNTRIMGRTAPQQMTSPPLNLRRESLAGPKKYKVYIQNIAAWDPARIYSFTFTSNEDGDTLTPLKKRILHKFRYEDDADPFGLDFLSDYEQKYAISEIGDLEDIKSTREQPFIYCGTQFNNNSNKKRKLQ